MNKSDFLPRLRGELNMSADLSLNAPSASGALPSIRANAPTARQLVQPPIRVSKVDNSFSMRSATLEIRNDFLPRRNIDPAKRQLFMPKASQAPAPATLPAPQNLPKLTRAPQPPPESTLSPEDA